MDGCVYFVFTLTSDIIYTRGAHILHMYLYGSGNHFLDCTSLINVHALHMSFLKCTDAIMKFLLRQYVHIFVTQMAFKMAFNIRIDNYLCIVDIDSGVNKQTWVGLYNV
jgi:hypothetical protein